MNITPRNLGSEAASPTRPRYIMIGGFLGAGKTTALGRLAQWLTDRGIRVGMITNDQGCNLVDTALLRSQGFVTEEIPGGCFCCRFNSLLDASKRLSDTTSPEVFLAEPVGSCTDLAATVTYPLRRLHADTYTVAPISVLLDPTRALRAFGLQKGDSFTDKVFYIYLKQIEEADLVVISKCDLVDSSQLERLRQAIAAKYPQKEILAVSVRKGINLEGWFNRIMSSEQKAGTSMQVDYQVYADGEALLGWLNCAAQLKAQQAFDAGDFLKSLASAIQEPLQTLNAQVAHLKMTFKEKSEENGIAAVSVARNDCAPELSFCLMKPVVEGRLIINLRAEADPEVLAQSVHDSLGSVSRKFPSMTAIVDHLECFRPGKPTPTHRIEKLTV
ncbi:MAG TPA: GTP-binding protein [Candidatus Paceibacterota bacterium]|nr:GTP-binding protein [Candidatus Paceibacterota bacterium]HSA03435.1 GTP-binding protein [Candidatus Paceibacterota bacterium]